MGYPNSIFSFTTKSAGQTIQSATINDLQNEVAAIETALVTGPITLPASTVASLSVTGGSTLAGVVQLGAGMRVNVSTHSLSGGSTDFNDLALSTASYMIHLVPNSTSVRISGIAGGAHGRVLWLVNDTPVGNVTLVHNTSSSALGNRFAFSGGASITIGALGTQKLVYSTASSQGSFWWAMKA